MAGWHSLRHHLGIKAFGINAVTVNKGEHLVKKHNEDDQQEVFIVIKGKAEFVVNDDKVVLSDGDIIAVDPEPSRSAVALESPTTLIIVGAPVDKAYKIPNWEK